MDRIRNKRLKPALLLLAVLLLRATIPVGFMPAAAGSGLLVVFCPDGACGECEGGVTSLTFVYDGDAPAQIAVFDDDLQPTADSLRSIEGQEGTAYTFELFARPHARGHLGRAYEENTQCVANYRLWGILVRAIRLNH